MSYTFATIPSGPATPITGCYHADWMNRDQYRNGTQVLVLYSPDDWRRTFNEGEEVMLSDCYFGLVLRRMLNDQQRIIGARFQTIEVLNDESPSRSLPNVAMPHSALLATAGSL